MAHYAFLDENNMVTEVIVGIDETELIENLNPEIWYGNFRGQTCVRTSYNGRIRGRFAGIGYSYDADRDLFISPRPFLSWITDETGQWHAPIPYPDDGKYYLWDEETQEWVVS